MYEITENPTNPINKYWSLDILANIAVIFLLFEYNERIIIQIKAKKNLFLIPITRSDASKINANTLYFFDDL